jgi:glutathione S-transferase
VDLKKAVEGASTAWWRRSVSSAGSATAPARLVFLPQQSDAARLPLSDYPAVAAWLQRLMPFPAWADPFDGVEAPEPPPVRC